MNHEPRHPYGGRVFSFHGGCHDPPRGRSMKTWLGRASMARGTVSVIDRSGPGKDPRRDSSVNDPVRPSASRREATAGSALTDRLMTSDPALHSARASIVWCTV